jgi:hypothetical protein
VIDDQLNNLILRNHMILNDLNLTGLNLQLIEEATQSGKSGKLRQATNALMYL